MKREIAGTILALLVVLLAAGLVLTGCVPQSELEECQAQKADLEGQISGLESQVNNLSSQVTNLEAQKTDLETQKADLEGQIPGLENEKTELEDQATELTEQNADLKAEVEYLREPPPEVSGEIAGYISFQKTLEVGKRFFPHSGVGASGSSRHKHALNTVETLEQFLANEPKFPSCRPGPNGAGDGWAFQLKYHWIEAGLSPWSLGLAKVEEDIPSYGRMLVWRCVFLTKENGEFVFYEVNPCPRAFEMTKIENGEQTEKYRKVMVSSRLWVID